MKNMFLLSSPPGFGTQLIKEQANKLWQAKKKIKGDSYGRTDDEVKLLPSTTLNMNELSCVKFE